MASVWKFFESSGIRRSRRRRDRREDDDEDDGEDDDEDHNDDDEYEDDDEQEDEEERGVNTNDKISPQPDGWGTKNIEHITSFSFDLSGQSSNSGTDYMGDILCKIQRRAKK